MIDFLLTLAYWGFTVAFIVFGLWLLWTFVLFVGLSIASAWHHMTKERPSAWKGDKP